MYTAKIIKEKVLVIKHKRKEIIGGVIVEKERLAAKIKGSLDLLKRIAKEVYGCEL